MTLPINATNNLTSLASGGAPANAIVMPSPSVSASMSQSPGIGLPKSEPLQPLDSGNVPRGKILIVDDEIANVRVLKRYLSGVGYADILTTTDSSTRRRRCL